jgi:arginine:pyruvate transaminase
VWVVVDEVYESLCYERQHVSLASLPGMSERCVVVSSLSKSHAMTGWRMGWIVATPALIRHAENLSLSMVYGLPGFVMEAALVAVNAHDEVTAGMREIYQRRRNLVVTGLQDCASIAVLKPDTGMFVLLDIRATGLSSLDFAWRLLREGGVAVLDAAAFGQPSQGFVRLSFTVSDEHLTQACLRIKAFVNTLTA